MFRTFLFAKIHRATVTAANVHYVGSITIDSELLAASGIRPYERVQVVDVDNGERLETYVIAGPPGSGAIELNGAAARLVQVGDKVIIMAYAQVGRAAARRLGAHRAHHGRCEPHRRDPPCGVGRRDVLLTQERTHVSRHRHRQHQHHAGRV